MSWYHFECKTLLIWRLGQHTPTPNLPEYPPPPSPPGDSSRRTLGGGVFPIMGFTGRLCPKGVPFMLAIYYRVGKIVILGYERVTKPAPKWKRRRLKYMKGC